MLGSTGSQCARWMMGWSRPIVALCGLAGRHLTEPLASLHTTIVHRRAVPSAGEPLHGAHGCDRYFVVRGGTPRSFVIPANHSITSLCKGMPWARRSCSSSYSDKPG